MKRFPVSQPDISLVRGVFNEVLFQVRNIDVKPVRLLDTDVLTINIVDDSSDTMLMQRPLTVADPVMGVYQFVAQPSEMDTWPPGPFSWSIMKNASMLWTDLTYTPTGLLTVIEGPIPGPGPTTTVLGWSDFTLADDGWYYSAALPGARQDGYVNGMHTATVNMAAAVGTVRMDGMMTTDWSSLASVYCVYALAVVNVQGDYQWFRIAIKLDEGVIDQAMFKG